MRPKSIVMVGSGSAARIAAKRINEVDHEARIVFFDKTSANEISLDMEARAVTVREDEAERRVGFDALIFCPEVSSPKLGIPGLIESDLIFCSEPGKTVILIGCSPDAIATAIRLRTSGCAVTIVEKAPRILPQFSFDTSQRIVRALRQSQIEARLYEEVTHAERGANGRIILTTSKGTKLETDGVLSGAEALPDVDLLAQAGAMISSDGTLLVDATMSTSLNGVFACGDGVSILKALSFNRQPRPSLSIIERGAQVAGTNAARHIEAPKEKMQPCAGSEIVAIGDLYFARTGLSSQEIHQMYPADKCVRETVILGETMVRLYAARDGGALICGELVGNFETICRLEIISQCILSGLKADAIIGLDVPSIFREAAEHLQAALNRETAGISGEKIALWLAEHKKFEWLEVGENFSPVSKHFKHAKHVPLKDLKKKLAELPLDSPLVLTSPSGRSAKLAYRVLKKKGFSEVFHLEGGSETLELLMGI